MKNREFKITNFSIFLLDALVIFFNFDEMQIRNTPQYPATMGNNIF